MSSPSLRCDDCQSEDDGGWGQGGGKSERGCEVPRVRDCVTKSLGIFLFLEVRRRTSDNQVSGRLRTTIGIVNEIFLLF